MQPHLDDVFPSDARPVPGSPHARYVTERLGEVGAWGLDSYASTVDRHAERDPDGDAFIEADRRMSWWDYRSHSNFVASALMASSVSPRARVGVIFPDGGAVHSIFVGVEKAGLTIVGIGPRAGRREIEHILATTGATALVSPARHRDVDMISLAVDLPSIGTHLVVDKDDQSSLWVAGELVTPDDVSEQEELIADRRLGIGDLWLVNSTSGTTGLPKCVAHNQNRWIYYHTLTTDAGSFTTDDVFMSVIPAPFGFGIWTAHVTPLLLGAPTVVMERFDADGAMDLIEQEGVTVLSCVSTQFIMMLNSPRFDAHDWTRLRCIFTGGEPVPFQRSEEFERRTGARVLQFFGSNETGGLSRTRMSDSRERRLLTSGQIIEGMNVRLLDEDGRDVTTSGGPGQAACAGPATCLGYYGDAEANRELFTDDGFMLTGDICRLDDEHYLTLVGRASDIIIRGGKNISAPAVEAEILSHEAVALAAAVAMPDAVFGERVCAYVVFKPGAQAFTLLELVEYLEARGVSKEMRPERLEIVDDLPRSSGGKVAKGELREDIRRRLQEADA